MFNVKMKIIVEYFSAIWIVSIALLVEASYVQMESKQPTNVKPPFNDFKVEAEVYPEGKNTLHLKITWDQNTTNDSIFHVLVNPIAGGLCHYESCNSHGEISYNATLFVPTKPPTQEEIHSHECEITPGCNYTVIVESDNFESQVDYTVPDQVGHLHTCQHAMKLPVVKTSAKINSGTLTINWTVSASDNVPSDIKVYIVAFISKAENIKNILQVFNHTLDSSKQQSGQFKWNVPLNEVDYLTRTFVYDSHDCSTNYPHVARAKADKNATPEKPVSEPVQVKWMIIAVLSSGVTIILILSVMYFRSKPKKPFNRGLQRLPPGITLELNPEYSFDPFSSSQLQRCDTPNEIPHSSIQIIKKIGGGAFGVVYVATGRNICGVPGLQNVAVKQLKRPTGEQRDEFFSEIETMKKVPKHSNIVALLGYCTVKEPLRIVMEFVGCGDLVNYLHKLRDRHEEQYGRRITIPNEQSHPLLAPSGRYLDLMNSSTTTTSDSSHTTECNGNNLRPSVTETMYTTLSNGDDVTSNRNQLEYVLDHNELYNFAMQIANGMKHLHDQKITHRDLAARNILIDGDKTLKISDFGLSRSGVYVNTKNKVVPLRWLSIEAIRDNLYSDKSDVWAFGIVLWEIGALGGHPYHAVSNNELLSYLCSGNRLEKPDNCSNYLYELMLDCWAHRPDDRPDFSEILSKLEPHQQYYVAFSEISSDYVFPPTKEQIQNLSNGVKH